MKMGWRQGGLVEKERKQQSRAGMEEEREVQDGSAGSRWCIPMAWF